MKTEPPSMHIVLIGGGHAHVTVIRDFGMRPPAGVVLTVIAKEIEAPYSGMLPGYVAGHYTYDDVHIDLVSLASGAGCRLVHGAVTSIDRRNKRVEIEGRIPLRYDLLSIDVGITPKLDDIAGAAQHAIAVKPVSTFARKWADLERRALAPDGPRRMLVVGAGAAGFELVLAQRHRLITRAQRLGLDAGRFTFTLVGAGLLLPSHNRRARQLAYREIAQQGVELIENARVVSIDSDAAHLDDGRRLPCDAVMLTTNAGPAGWFSQSGLPLDERGFIAVRPTLQLLDDDDVFAVGDCASVLEYPREKAGVFAVRQGPPLAENLRLRSQGRPAEPFEPQKQFLTLLSTGGPHAIAARNGLAISGNWVWRWKDRIDRDFMAMFASPFPMAEPTDEMRCAGCAAKVGPVTLANALDHVGIGDDTAREDAALFEEGDGRVRLETIDYFRSFWSEPYLFGEIAAVHAMSDVHAMGGRPSHALANVVVAHGSPSVMQEDLVQVLAGAASAMQREGVRIAGGHSSEGAELAAGFFVSGYAAPQTLLRKSGLRVGDRLVLTRPIGTGLLFAALMRGLARGRWIAAALSLMRRSNSMAADVLQRHGATAASDVTGFGLGGHLLEMLSASQVGARVALDAVPIYDGALQLAQEGVSSTLLPENLRLASRLSGAAAADATTLAVFFDPQTSGGLLAGVPAARLDACLADLRANGVEHAAAIGEVVAHLALPDREAILEGHLRMVPTAN